MDYKKIADTDEDRIMLGMNQIWKKLYDRLKARKDLKKVEPGKTDIEPSAKQERATYHFMITPSEKMENLEVMKKILNPIGGRSFNTKDWKFAGSSVLKGKNGSHEVVFKYVRSLDEKKASTKKKADMGQDILFSLVGEGSSKKGMDLYWDAYKNLEDSGDEQSAELLVKVSSQLSDALQISSKQMTAYGHFVQGIKLALRGRQDGNARNQIFKAANALGIRLPSSMFASIKDEIQKLASDHPELRKHLVPLLKNK